MICENRIYKNRRRSVLASSVRASEIEGRYRRMNRRRTKS